MTSLMLLIMNFQEKLNSMCIELEEQEEEEKKELHTALYMI